MNSPDGPSSLLLPRPCGSSKRAAVDRGCLRRRAGIPPRCRQNALRVYGFPARGRGLGLLFLCDGEIFPTMVDELRQNYIRRTIKKICMVRK